VIVGSSGRATSRDVREERRSVCPALHPDVTNQASIAGAAERIRKELGRLDVLVNNAGISHTGRPDRRLHSQVDRRTRRCHAPLYEIPGPAGVRGMMCVWETDPQCAKTVHSNLLQGIS
jgi:NAD(P)-dependent dehydrogenase (short-subunit alcohol dehydrogenase family)